MQPKTFAESKGTYIHQFMSIPADPSAQGHASQQFAGLRAQVWQSMLLGQHPTPTFKVGALPKPEHFMPFFHSGAQFSASFTIS
jgi:hypothetical protein